MAEPIKLRGRCAVGKSLAKKRAYREGGVVSAVLQQIDRVFHPAIAGLLALVGAGIGGEDRESKSD